MDGKKFKDITHLDSNHQQDNSKTEIGIHDRPPKEGMLELNGFTKLNGVTNFNGRVKSLHSNGTVTKDHSIIEIGAYKQTLLTLFYQLLGILKWFTPLWIYLSLYRMNRQLHILPMMTDMHKVHLYNISYFEQHVFGFEPHRIVAAFHNPIFDVLTVFVYIQHYFQPAAFVIFLWAKDRVDLVHKYAWLLGWTSLIVYGIYFIFPTFPPWWQDGLVAFQGKEIPSNPEDVINIMNPQGCAFARVDNMVEGSDPVFKLMGGKQKIVPFAAFPSGHLVWPTCIYLIRPPGGRWFLIFISLVAWTTMYSCHHYITDVIGGIMVAIIVNKIMYNSQAAIIVNKIMYNSH